MVQEPPFGSRPHEVPTQVAGAVHIALVVQLFTQVRVAESQRPGAQFAVAGVGQLPLPSHVEGGRRVEAVRHAAARHCVPAGYRAQAPPAH